MELDDIYLSGYWQSEQYFYDIRDHILKLYRLPKTVNVDNCNILKDIERENSVSIHIRRGIIWKVRIVIYMVISVL